MDVCVCVCVQLGSFSTEKQWEWTNVCHSQESKKIILMLPDIMSDIIRWCVVLYHTLSSWVLQCAPKVSENFCAKTKFCNNEVLGTRLLGPRASHLQLQRVLEKIIAWTGGVLCATTDSRWDKIAWTMASYETWLSLSGGVLAWLSDRSEVQTCIWPSWCHCHSLSLASVKSRLVLPFWYQLTRVVPE